MIIKINNNKNKNKTLFHYTSRILKNFPIDLK